MKLTNMWWVKIVLEIKVLLVENKASNYKSIFEIK